MTGHGTAKVSKGFGKMSVNLFQSIYSVYNNFSLIEGAGSRQGAELLLKVYQFF